MTLALLARLKSGYPDVQAFLQAALVLDRPNRENLAAANLPLYTIDAYLPLLRHAAELGEAGWQPQVREAYRALLTPSPPATGRTARSPGELPREKALAYGTSGLTDAELVAILLRTGRQGEDVHRLAERLLQDHEGLVGLAGLSPGQLSEEEGLGPAKSAEVAAAFEIARRLTRSARRERPELRSPEQVLSVVGADLLALTHEEFWCLPLDTRSRLMGEPSVISKGDIDGTEAGPRAFFRAAVQRHAHAAIAVHNHPSGNPSPSAADLAITRRLVAAGRLLDLALADHLVVGDGGSFVSIRRLHPELFAG